MDGSKGQIITQTVSLGDAGRYNFYLRNIPVGIYSAAATLTTPAGEKKQLRAKVSKQGTALRDVSWTETVMVSFPASVAHNNGGGGGTGFAELYLAPPGEDDTAVAVQPNTPTVLTKTTRQIGDGEAPPNIAEPDEADAEIEAKYAQPDFKEVTPFYTIVKWDYDAIDGWLNMVIKPKTNSAPTIYDVEYVDADGVVIYSQNVSFSMANNGVGQPGKFYVKLMFGEKDMSGRVKSVRFARRR